MGFRFFHKLKPVPPDLHNAPLANGTGFRLWCSALLMASAAFAQPSQPAPAQPSYSLQDSNLKPALPGALAGVSIEQRLNQQVPLDVNFRDEAGRTMPLASFF